MWVIQNNVVGMVGSSHEVSREEMAGLAAVNNFTMAAPASRDPLLRHVGSSDCPDCVQDTLSGCHVTILDNLDGS